MAKQKEIQQADGQVAELLQRWQDAKIEEKAAQIKRHRIEEALHGLLKTDRHYDVGETRFTPTQPIKYSIDSDAWHRIADEVPDDIVRHKVEVDAAKFRALRTLNPEAYQRAAQAITAKPGKLSITMKPVEVGSGA